MNKRFYIAINVLLGLLTAIGLLENLFQFLIGSEVFKLKVYFPWLWTGSIVSLLMSLLLLKYYWSRKYWLVFSLAVAMTLINTISSYIFYMTLISTAMHPYYLPTLSVFHVTTLIYSSCLVFTASGKRFWLRLSGIFMYIISTFVTLSLLALYYINSTELHALFEKISVWSSLVYCLVPIFFIINFNAEIRQLKDVDTTLPSGKFSTIALYILVTLSFLAVLTFGIMLGVDVYRLKQ